MNECLVTKLKTVINDSSFEILGNIKLNIADFSGDNLLKRIKVTPQINAKVIEGNVRFVDNDFISNPVSSKEKVSNIFLNGEKGVIALDSKYELTSFYVGGAAGNNMSELNLDDFAYCKNLSSFSGSTWVINGQLKSLNNLPLSSLSFSGSDLTKVHGSISDMLKVIPNLRTLTLSNRSLYHDDGVGYARNITGNISVLKDALNLEDIVLIGLGEVVGDISVFNNLPNIKSVSFRAVPGLHGDATTLIENGIITESNFMYNTNVYADLSKLQNISYVASTMSNTSTCSWTTERASNLPIVAMLNVRLGEYVDAMLINQAKCTANISSSSPEDFKTIRVHGTRTDASNIAVQTLKDKGYSVVVNDIVL